MTLRGEREVEDGGGKLRESGEVALASLSPTRPGMFPAPLAPCGYVPQNQSRE